MQSNDFLVIKTNIGERKTKTHSQETNIYLMNDKENESHIPNQGR